jgi:hypothetical protein
MKKFFAVPLAVLFVAACSDSSTAPVSNSADLTPSYAKPGSGGSGITPAQGTLVSASYHFDVGTVDVSAGTGIGSDTDNLTQASDAGVLQYVPASNGTNGFIGRFDNTHTRALAVFNTVGTKYTVDFDLYVIGSWDGRGKQAQNGTFQANVFQVGYRCGSGTATVVPLFTTTFSNQYTVQQDFPNAYLAGGYKAGTGSVPGSIDALDYKDHPELSNTPTFRSFGDATYHFSYTITTECGSVAPTFVFSSTAPGQQSNYDESWGLDNIIMKAD